MCVCVRGARSAGVYFRAALTPVCSVLNAFACILQLDGVSPTDSLCILERMKDFIAAAHVAGSEAHHLQSLIEHAVWNVN